MVKKTGHKHRPGAAVLEFAILAPILVFLVLGTLEVSRAAMVSQALNDAARSACRQGIQGGVSTATIKANAADAIKDVPLKPAVTVIVWVNGNNTVDASTAVKGDTIAVEITVPFSAVSWTTSVFMTGDTLVSKKVTMMRQQ
jgi:Flp pilus assembly protein TadG